MPKTHKELYPYQYIHRWVGRHVRIRNRPDIKPFTIRRVVPSLNGLVTPNRRHGFSNNAPTLIRNGIGTHGTMRKHAAIVETLPPIPKAYARDKSGRYFVPAELETWFCENQRYEITEFFEVYPWHIVLDHFGSEVKYFTRIGGEIAEVTLILSTGPYIGKVRLTGDFHYYGRGDALAYIDRRRVEHAGTNLEHITLDIYQGDRWAGQFERPIIYAQGSRDNLGTAELYAHTAGETASFAEFMAPLMEERT